MKVLVTGGAGFIGSHTIEALMAEGVRVEALDNLSTGFAHNLPAGVPLIEADVADERTTQIVARGRYEAVFHLAAQIDVRTSMNDPVFDATTNVVGSIRVLEGCRIAGTKKFIFASTGGACYGEQDYFPADENHPLRPISPYGAAKVSVETYLHVYTANYGMECFALRYANVYGPRQNPHGEAGVVAIFLNRMLQGLPPRINGDGLQTRDYVYVGDVARANVLALTTLRRSGAYNVGTGKEHTVVDVFNGLNAFFDERFTPEFAPAKAGEQRRSCVSSQKLLSETGFAPQTPLAEGLKLTAEWFKKHRC
ncbi:MAG: NAD-dependent epimerase/dehydratase family protein [Bacteroidia bacterium]|nr:NAD-dependent epimerase/dehydratase family protein [Bacteroidia bacterium]